MRISLLSLVLLLSTFVAKSQISQRACDTIPYKLVHQKIIFPVTINDTTVNFILDTGGQTGIMYQYVEKLGITLQGGGRSVADYGGNSLLYGKGVLKNATFGSNYKIGSVDIMIFPEIGLFYELGVVGIISGDALAQCVLTIDSKLQILVINHPYRPERLKVEDGEMMEMGGAKHTILKCKFGGIERNILFDTGAHGFLMLSETDFKKFPQGTSEVVQEGYGINGVGIGGIGKARKMDRVVVHELDFAGKRFENVETTVGTEGISIIGLDMIKYGKFVIDYMRSRLFFLRYDDEVVKSVYLDKRWDVSVLPSDKGFEVTAVWGDAQTRVKYGEKVVDINGKSLDKIEKNQLIIDAMMSDIVEDKAYIIVQDSLKKQRKVEIFRK